MFFGIIFLCVFLFSFLLKSPLSCKNSSYLLYEYKDIENVSFSVLSCYYLYKQGVSGSLVFQSGCIRNTRKVQQCQWDFPFLDKVLCNAKIIQLNFDLWHKHIHKSMAFSIVHMRSLSKTLHFWCNV